MIALVVLLLSLIGLVYKLCLYCAPNVDQYTSDIMDYLSRETINQSKKSYAFSSHAMKLMDQINVFIEDLEAKNIGLSSQIPLGFGASGVVMAGRYFHQMEVCNKNIPESLPVAIKVCFPITVSKRIEFLNEVNILSKLTNHDNIVKIVDFFNSSFRCHLVMERASLGTLGEYCKKNPRSEVFVKPWINELVSAVNFIHSKQIFHRDIKPDNCLLFLGGQPPHFLKLKLTDFGISQEEECMSHSIGGTRSYMAPEILKLKYYRVAVKRNKPETRTEYRLDLADWWAVGATIFKILHGSFLLEMLNPDANLVCFLKKIFETDGKMETDLVLEARFRELFQFKATISSSTKALLAEMLEPLPEKRMVNFKLLFEQWTENLGTIITNDDDKN